MPRTYRKRPARRYSQPRGVQKVAAAAVKRAVAATAEKKFVDKLLTNVCIDTGGTSTLADAAYLKPLLYSSNWTGNNPIPPTTVAVGSGVNERVGKKTQLRYMYIKLLCSMITLPDAPNPPNTFLNQYPNGMLTKFYVVLDRSPNNQSPPDRAEIWYPDNAGNYTIRSQRNHDKTARFQILGEFSMSMSPGVMCPCMIEKYVSLKGIQQEYSGTGATYADVVKNQITIWYAQSSAPVSAAGTVNYTGEIRTVYVDI